MRTRTLILMILVALLALKFGLGWSWQWSAIVTVVGTMILIATMAARDWYILRRDLLQVYRIVNHNYPQLKDRSGYIWLEDVLPKMPEKLKRAAKLVFALHGARMQGDWTFNQFTLEHIRQSAKGEPVNCGSLQSGAMAKPA